MRVKVNVSADMNRLRQSQIELNGFYSSVLLSLDIAKHDIAMRELSPYYNVWDAYGTLRSNLRRPNRNGQTKANYSISDFSCNIERSLVHVCRATMISFYSVFEEFLECRIESPRFGRRWGPLYKSLSYESLSEATTPILLGDLLCADLCREIRNRVVHDAFSEKLSTDPKDFERWEELAVEGLGELG